MKNTLEKKLRCCSCTLGKKAVAKESHKFLSGKCSDLINTDHTVSEPGTCNDFCIIAL